MQVDAALEIVIAYASNQMLSSHFGRLHSLHGSVAAVALRVAFINMVKLFEFRHVARRNSYFIL